MNPLQMSSSPSPRKSTSIEEALNLTSSPFFQGSSPNQEANIPLLQVQDTLSFDDFSQLLNSKPGLLTLSEESWSRSVESQGEDYYYVHLKFHKKERIRRLASFFPANKMSMKKVDALEITPKEPQQSTLSKKIFATHAQYELMKRKEETEVSSNGKGVFFVGTLTRKDFTDLLNSFALMLCLKKCSWSKRSDANSFIVKLSFFEELVRDVEPVKVFGEKFGRLLTKVGTFDAPENHDDVQDDLKAKIQESYQYYLEGKNGKTRRQGRRDNNAILDEEELAKEGEKEKRKDYSQAQKVSANSRKPLQQPPKLPQQAQKVEPPKDVPLDLLSNLISRAQEANFQPRFPNNKTVPIDFSTQNPVSYTEKRYSENPHFAEKNRKE